MINIDAENVRLWVNAHERPDGTRWYSYSISSSSKTEAGDYVNKSLKVKMTRDVQLPQDLVNGELADIRGFLSNETYMSKEGEKRIEHVFVAKEVDFPNRRVLKPQAETDSFSAAEDEIPF